MRHNIMIPGEIMRNKILAKIFLIITNQFVYKLLSLPSSISCNFIPCNVCSTLCGANLS